MDAIGFICEPDHPVFGPVAERLSARGFAVRFFRPGDPVPETDIDELSALANATIHPSSFAALYYADRTGVETWNGFTATTALSCRLVALAALERVGCRVPDVRFEKPEGEYVGKHRFRWTGSDDEGFYQERVRTDPVDYRYYAVDDGRETHLRALRIRTELTDSESVVADADVDITRAARVRELLDRFEARALGVDFTAGDDGYYALDVIPSPSFYGTMLGRQIADSVASLTTIGA